MLDGFPRFLSYLAVMAAVTYLIRLLPLLFIRHKIKNRFIRSLLYYIPYSVLSAMTFPAIFYSTGYISSAIIGTAAAFALAFSRRGLLCVAAGAVLSVFITELIIPYVPFLAF